MSKKKSIIKSIDEQGNITEHCSYNLSADKALVCYLEQTINKRYDTWNYWQNFIDVTGNEHKTRSRFIDIIMPLPSKKGYAIDFGDRIICAYEQ